jgi:hypothetical protein
MSAGVYRNDVMRLPGNTIYPHLVSEWVWEQVAEGNSGNSEAVTGEWRHLHNGELLNITGADKYTSLVFKESRVLPEPSPQNKNK